MSIATTLWRAIVRAFHEDPIERQRNEAKTAKWNGTTMGVSGIAIAIIGGIKAVDSTHPLGNAATVLFGGLLMSYAGFKFRRWGMARLEANEFGDQWEFDGIKVVSVSLRESDVMAIRAELSMKGQVQGRLWKICELSTTQVMVHIRQTGATGDDQQFKIQKGPEGWEIVGSENAEIRRP